MNFWKKKPDESTGSTVLPGAGRSSSWSSDRAEGSSTTEKTVKAGDSASEVVQSGVSEVAESPVLDGLERRFGNVRSALGSGTNIQGKLSFDVAVRIDGQLGGEVFSSQPIIVGPSANIKASIQAASLIILGNVEGDVVVTDRVEILKGGTLRGTIQSPIFVLEEEGAFNGSVTMPRNKGHKKLAIG